MPPPASPFNFDFMNVGAPTAKPEYIQAPQQQDLGFGAINQWLIPMLQNSARQDINVFGYEKEIGAERGAEQNRLAKHIETERTLAEMRAKAGLGAQQEGMGDIDVTNVVDDPQASAAYTSYLMKRQGVTDEQADATKQWSVANTQSLIEQRQQEQERRAAKDAADAKFRDAKLEADRDLAEKRIDLTAYNQRLTQAYQQAQMSHMKWKEGFAQQEGVRRDYMADLAYEKATNPMLQPGVAAREEKQKPVMDALSYLRTNFKPEYVGLLDNPYGDVQRAVGAASPEYNRFRAQHEIARQYLANELYAGNLTPQEAGRFEQMISGKMGEGAYVEGIEALFGRAQSQHQLRVTPRTSSVGSLEERRKKVGGGSASDTGNGGLPTVTSQQQYDALPSGSKYKDASGRVGTKP